MMPSSKCCATFSQPVLFERHIIRPCWVPAYRRTPSLIKNSIVQAVQTVQIDQHVVQSTERFEQLEHFERLELHLSDLRKKFASSRSRLPIPTRFEATKIVPCSLRAALERDLRTEGAAFFRADRADLSQGCGLQGFFRVIFQYQSRVENFRQILSRDYDAVPAQQSGAFAADHFQQGSAALGIGDQLGLGVERH